MKHHFSWKNGGMFNEIAAQQASQTPDGVKLAKLKKRIADRADAFAAGLHPWVADMLRELLED